jgi:threonine/homoserine efflux transporter RhtA
MYIFAQSQILLLYLAGTYKNARETVKKIKEGFFGALLGTFNFQVYFFIKKVPFDFY